MSEFFLRSARLGFRAWRREDLFLAQTLWGDPQVSRYISKGGFSEAEIIAKLEHELAEQAGHGLQYWPTFLLDSGAHVGCCGLRRRPDSEEIEFGVHLRPTFWGQRLGLEAGRAVIALKLRRLFAGHHPENEVSCVLLARLGFRPTHLELYPPTGLLHPCYELLNPHRPERLPAPP
ncbi:MAG: GNAT family N-acetyltransferase [Verrucomicrobia bacterium]|nr:GNAT family N-acetyltransferase [Verrucomicrobiota bacterium]